MRRLYQHEIDPRTAHELDPDPTAAEDSLYHAVYRHRMPIRELVYDGVGMTAEEVASLVALYDGEIGFTDEVVGRFVAEIGAAHPEPPLVLITADHGESFGKGGVLCDHRGLYEGSIRVPFIVWWPGRIPQGTRLSGPAQTLDVAPTLLALAGLPPDPALPGRDLSAELLGGGGTLPDRPIFVEHANDAAVAVVDGRWKLILATTDHLEEGSLVYRHPGVELYDLATDPGETSNLAGTETERARQLLEAARRWMSTDRRAGPGPGRGLDPALREQLQALGYIQ
jgi:arylsulfatase A-like enzyme